jgi:hypothetical protein
MEKHCIVLIAIICLLQLSCSNEELTPAPKKAWTFLLYDDADFYNAYDPLNNFSNLVSSNSIINYLGKK